MIKATDLKNGATFLANDKPYQVVKYSLIKMGRGGAVVKVTARNLETGSLEEKSFSSNVSVEAVVSQKRQLNFLYKDKDKAVFMDPKTFEQVEIPLEVLGESISFVKEGGGVTVLYWEEKALSVELPPNVVMEVSACDPGVKGNSATNIYKPATLEGGVNIKVPLFINPGDMVRVDTRTKEYIERAKS